MTDPQDNLSAESARLKRVVAQYLWERIPTHDALQCDLWADGILALVAEHNDGLEGAS